MNSPIDNAAARAAQRFALIGGGGNSRLSARAPSKHASACARRLQAEQTCKRFVQKREEKITSKQAESIL